MHGRSSETRTHLILRIDLDDVEVPTWRTLVLDAQLGLPDLARAILLAFGWTGTGIFRFGTSHTPWWGRDADAWGCRVLTPARPPHVRRHEYGDEWDDPEAEPACRREWTVDEVTGRFDGELAFEYRQLGLHGVPGDPGPTWRHRITVTERDGASSRSPIPRAALLGGGGTVPRIGTEGAYGELADPSRNEALAHEFELAFGESARARSDWGRHDGTALESAVRDASDAARRALRIDLAALGALAPVQVDPDHVERATAEIRDLLRSAAAADGIDLAECGPLGDDLKALGLARVQKGRLRTLVATRDHLLEDPAALWAALAERLMRPSHWHSARPEVAELAIDLILADSPPGHDVRRFAFDEAQPYVGPRRLGDADLLRAKRILASMGLADDDGRPTHPAARAFALTMIRS